MKYIVPLCAMLLYGCVAPRVAYLTDAEVKEAFASAPAFATEPGHEKLHPWLNLKTEVRRELGHWQPDRDPTILVTVDVLNSSHCAGFFHQMLGVVDPTTGDLLTPVYHVTADEAQRMILHVGNQDVVLFSACVQGQSGYRRDCSVLLRFSGGRVYPLRPLGQRDPERFLFVTTRNGPQFMIRECAPGKSPDVKLRWNEKTGLFDEIENTDG